METPAFGTVSSYKLRKGNLKEELNFHTPGFLIPSLGTLHTGSDSASLTEPHLRTPICGAVLRLPYGGQWGPRVGDRPTGQWFD